MTMTRASLVAICVTAILLSSVGLAAADRGRDGGPRHGKLDRAEKAGKFLVHTDNLTVWFHEGKNHAKPDLRVAFPSGNANDTDDTSGYRVQVLRLYETASNSTAFDAKLPHVNLARADDWNVQTSEGNNTLAITMMRAEAQAVITLVFHVDTATNVVKYDVDVKDWKWANASDDLALDMLVIGHDLRNETGARVSVEGAGYISWATTAQGSFGANDTRTLSVTSGSANFDKVADKDENETDESDHEKSERDSGKGGHVILAFHGAGDAKDVSYDPEFGVVSTQSTAAKGVPGFAPALVAVAGFAVALVLRRKA